MRCEVGQTGVEGVTNNYARFRANRATELDRCDALWFLLRNERKNGAVSEKPAGWLGEKGVRFTISETLGGGLLVMTVRAPHNLRMKPEGR